MGVITRSLSPVNLSTRHTLRVLKRSLVCPIMRFIRPTLHPLFLLTLAGVGSALAVELQEQPEYRAAQQALQDGLPAVAAIKAAPSPTKASAAHLAKIIKSDAVPEAEKDRFMRAFDYQPTAEKDKALESLLQ